MARLDRLVALAELWTTVRFFHPWLAYRPELDWDAALVDVLLEIATADDTPTYSAALDRLLGSLGDPVTHIVPDPAAPARAAAESFVTWLDDGILLVSFDAISLSMWQTAITACVDLGRELGSASTIVFDLRGSELAEVTLAASGLDRRLSSAPIVGPGQRFRVHTGFPTQGGLRSGGYNSAFQVQDSRIFRPAKGALDRPIAFIVDERSELPAIALALRAAGKAVIVADGRCDEGSFVATRQIELGEGVVARIRVAEIVYPNGTGGFRPDLTSPLDDDRQSVVAAALSLLQAPRTVHRGEPLPAVAAPTAERGYPEMIYPPKEYRLLAAFRIWGTIEHFFPYHGLMDRDWRETLKEALPRFEAAADATEYAVAVAEMVRATDDSHVNISSAAFRRFVGEAPAAIWLRLIEGLPVVTRIMDQEAAGGSRLGDIVQSIDGTAAADRAAFLDRFCAASTPQARASAVASRLPFGPKDSSAEVQVEGVDGVRRVTVRRDTGFWPENGERDGEIVRILPGNLGYADLDRLQRADVDDMFARLGDCPAIIFDMRGYPKGTAWAIAPRLTDRPNVPGALVEPPLVSPTVLTAGERLGARNVARFRQKIPERTGGATYRGRTLMLIDERTGSQAEHTGLFFKAVADTILVGSPTMGVNGDVTWMILPGDISVSFTGQAILHADGRQLQRVGLVPDVPVSPTIAGIRAGRDEVLERAIEIARGLGC